MGKNKKFKARKKFKCLAEIQLERLEGRTVESIPEKPKKPKFIAIKKPKTEKIIESEKFKHYKIKAEKYSKELKKGTPAELKLKAIFDADGILYSFQKPFYSTDRCYIVDFFFTNVYGKRYVVELDGSSHIGREVYDIERTIFLKRTFNVHVIRFKNHEVHHGIDKVVNEIYKLKPRCLDNLTPLKQENKMSKENLPVKLKPRPIYNDIEGVKKEITYEGQPCRKCLTPVIKRIPSQVEKPKQKFKYAYYFFCKKCKTMYMPKEAIEWIIK